MIAFAGCKDTTYECMKALIESGETIELLITIDSENAMKNKVAGFYDLKDFALSNGIKVYTAKSYSLKQEMESLLLRDYEIDLLIVIGWQRLIPDWLLNSVKYGVYGMHGSSRALPYGRGRSPMNWSIIQNKKMFITNLFKYKPGIDDGDILDSMIFDLNVFDNARTCHYKNTLAMINLLKKNLTRILADNVMLRPQLEVTPTYYSKRSADDGVIFWNRDTIEIYNLVRAVTKPFPGAFTFSDENKILIWDAQPFDTRLFSPNLENGKVLKVFHNGHFIVKTGSDTLLVTDYEAPSGIQIYEGIVFHSGNFTYYSYELEPKAL